MMRKTLNVLVAAAIPVLLIAAPARADVQRRIMDQRPYIVEIGAPYAITMDVVRHEARKISHLAEYLRTYGYPDYAEIQEIEPEWPWESYEVRLYYMRRNLETDFGHVFVSSAMPNFGVLKYQGSITPEKRHEIEVILQARLAPPAAPPVRTAAVQKPAPVVIQKPAPAKAHAEQHGLTEALVARIEAAAERASQAADHATEASDAAVRAADHTVSILQKMEGPAEGARAGE